METAGNDQFDDDTEKKGLGTPATRAGIIEKLVKSGFAERKGKSLIPTKDGCNIVCVLPEQITSPAMTAEWENTLMEIEHGNADADAFLSGIVRMTGDLVKAYPFLSDAEAQRFGTGTEEKMCIRDRMKITDLDKMKIEEQKKAVRSGYDMDIIPSDLATFGLSLIHI